MRDPKRIKVFCDELAEIWESQCPDWRFGQLLVNVLRAHNMKDPFYIEENDLMRMIRECFGLNGGGNE